MDFHPIEYVEMILSGSKSSEETVTSIYSFYCFMQLLLKERFLSTAAVFIVFLMSVGLVYVCMSTRTRVLESAPALEWNKCPMSPIYIQIKTRSLFWAAVHSGIDVFYGYRIGQAKVTFILGHV